jgi:pyruvate,orthophosphate dikinase
MQDLEFTIQDGKLWLLQTRNGKRTGSAMVKIAMDMLKEGLIDEKRSFNAC